MAIFQNEKIFLILFQSIFIKILVSVNSEYAINDSSNGLFLEANFTGTWHDIFPQNLEIIVYLSRMDGLLFYSYDRTMNQLIVTLQDTKIASMQVKFRNEKYVLLLNDLCKCKNPNCLYEKLALKFEIVDFINIQCNSGVINTHSFTNNKLTHNDYPMPTFSKTNITAFLWLINIPSFQNTYNRVYANPESFTGCIYNVTYNNKPVTLKGQFKNCEKKCKADTCNGGECIETYNVNPICNCTNAFLNGPYCNDIITGKGSHSFQFEFQIIKVSLELKELKEYKELKELKELKDNSSKWENFNLYSTNGKEIKIVLSESKSLVLSYYNNQPKSNTSLMLVEYKIELLKSPIIDGNYTLLIELIDNNLMVKVKNMEHNNSWIESSLFIGSGFKGSFDSSFIPCPVVWDVAYKVYKYEIGWLAAKLEKNLLSHKEDSTKKNYPCKRDTEPDSENNSKILIAIYTLIPVIFFSYGFLAYYLIRKEKTENCNLELI